MRPAPEEFPSGADTLAPKPRLHRLPDEPQQRYWVCAPAGGAPAPAGVLVSVHGISRNARVHALALAPVAAELGLVLVAPHFSRRHFPDYQRLGRPARLGPGGRADRMLLRIVRAVQLEFSLEPRPVMLMGHSGGAQFALRFSFVHTSHIQRYALSAAGSYCWPLKTRRFPYGLAPGRSFPDLKPDLHALLARPGLVLVGECDDERDAALRQGERIDAEQGRTRVERARNWVAAMNALADVHGQAQVLRMQTVPYCGHRFSGLAQSQVWRDALCRHFAAGQGA